MSVQALNKIIPISSQGDVFALGQESDWADMGLTDVSAPKRIDLIDSKKITGGDYLPAGLLVTESSIVRAKEVIDLMYKTGNAARTSVIPGSETSGGSLMALFTADDNVAVFQAMAHDKSPSFTLLGDVGSKTIQLDLLKTASLTSTTPLLVTNDPANDVTDLSGVPTALVLEVIALAATITGPTATLTIAGKDTAGADATATVQYVTADLVTGAALGEVLQYNGETWVSRGNLTDLTGITTLGAVAVSDTAITGAGSNNDITIFSAALADGFTGAPVVPVMSGDVYQSDGTNWADRGNLADLDGISAVGTVTAGPDAATVNGLTPAAGDIVVVTTAIASGLTGLGIAKTTGATTFGEVDSVTPAGFTGGTFSVKSVAMALKGMLPDPINIASNLDVTVSGALMFNNNLSAIDNPVQVQVIPNTGAALATGQTFATVRIVGIDHYDNPLDKTLTFVANAGGGFDPLQTVAFWKQINNIYGDDNWAAGSTVNIRATDKACEVEVHPQDSEDVVYFTVAGNKGDIPDRNISQLLTTLTIGNARNEALLFQLESMGYRALLRTDMANVQGVNAEKIDFSNLTPAAPNVYPGWACFVEVAGERQPYTTSSIAIAQGYTYSGVMGGTPYEEVRPYRNDLRSVMIDGTVNRTKANDLVGKYAANVIYEDVRYVFEMTHAETFNWKTEIILRESQLSAETDVASPTGIDRYLQQQNLRAFSNSFGNPRDWYAKIRLSNYNRVRDYA